MLQMFLGLIASLTEHLTCMLLLETANSKLNLRRFILCTYIGFYNHPPNASISFSRRKHALAASVTWLKNKINK